MSATAGYQSEEWRILNLVRSVQSQAPVIKAIGFVGLLVAVAALDLVLDPNLSLYVLYLVPTLYATWFLGSRLGYASCLACAGIWIADDWGRLVLYNHPLISYWNLTGKLIVLMVIVAIVNTLKRALEEEYEFERRWVQREFGIAHEVQMRLLPSQSPADPRVQLCFFYQPAQAVGGDYYDFIPLGPGRMALAVGDVSGKGLGSALVMASLQGLVRTSLALRDGELARFATETNLSLHELTDSERYVTLLVALVDVTSHTLEYVNAGHNSALLFRGGQMPVSGTHAPEQLDSGGPPLGVFPESQYQSRRIWLHSEDVLVLYTDGVVEAFNSQGVEFGEERLRDVVHGSFSVAAAEICHRIKESLRAFLAESGSSDDMTLVVMKVNPESTEGK